LKYLCIVSSLVHYQTILCFLSGGVDHKTRQ
jgi:hypothetical protein